MNKLTRNDLMSLEHYAQSRDEFRKKVIEHKKHRQVMLGEHATLYFEDRLTIQYQVQEMLRIERIFEAEAIQEELDAYNPLIPDGGNLKATFMIEYEDASERQAALANLVGIEDKVWISAEGCDKVYPIADEDLERDTEDKTSAVHFLRFELPATMTTQIKNGAMIAMGIDHKNYQIELSAIPSSVRESLAADLA
ncbi:MAG: DUF3501 family protein [Gammaproteobacteria bacterium]|nr:DUF3501 family protein [Gammaproteobacteria bacterium]